MSALQDIINYLGTDYRGTGHMAKVPSYLGVGQGRQLPSARMSRTLLGMHTNLDDDLLDRMVAKYPEMAHRLQAPGGENVLMDPNSYKKYGRALLRRLGR